MTHNRRTVGLFICSALLLVACGSVERESISVNDAWANATPVGVNIGAAYMEIVASQADKLLSAATTVADRIEMHTSAEQNGMMTMRPLETVELDAKKPFTFAPGGAHFMLVDLRQPLTPGMRFPMTLQFEKAGSITVQVEVVELGSR